jgi:hypothetical protein
LPSKDFKRLDRAVRDLLKLFTDDFDRHDSSAIESKTPPPAPAPAPAPASRRVRPSRTAADPS